MEIVLKNRYDGTHYVADITTNQVHVLFLQYAVDPNLIQTRLYGQLLFSEIDREISWFYSKNPYQEVVYEKNSFILFPQLITVNGQKIKTNILYTVDDISYQLDTEVSLSTSIQLFGIEKKTEYIQNDMPPHDIATRIIEYFKLNQLAYPEMYSHSLKFKSKYNKYFIDIIEIVAENDLREILRNISFYIDYFIDKGLVLPDDDWFTILEKIEMKNIIMDVSYLNKK